MNSSVISQFINSLGVAGRPHIT